MFVLGSIQWELLGWFAGAGCCALFVLAVLGTTGIVIWRSQQKAPPKAPPPELPAEAMAISRVLSEVVGYRPNEEQARVRERWGRPVTYLRTATEGARWSTPAQGEVLEITERSGRSGGIPTGDEALDQRFYIKAEHDAVVSQLADPDLRERLLALPWVRVTSDGTTVSFADSTLEAHRRIGATDAPGAPETPDRHVQLHDHVADILVLLADRVS